jgi:4'-phosphopantetheinyl transferase
LKAVRGIRGGSSDIHLQLAALGEAGEFASLLNTAENAQASRIPNESLRTRFVVSRGLRRRLLAECTGRPPAELEFQDAPGKPRLLGAGDWDFNLSHAGDHVAVAARCGPIGIDLEQHREVRDPALIVRRYFHADEAQAWRRLPKDRRASAFFLFWSAREAAMKCAGLGLAQGMSVTRVDPGFLEAGQGPASVGDRSLQAMKLDAPGGYTLVVCHSL